MRTSVGLWDALFGKRITLELPTADGSIRRVKVTAKWFDKMEREGMFKELPSSKVKVNILDPRGGLTLDRFDDPGEFLNAMIQSEDVSRVEYWDIGHQISKELYDECADNATRELYVIIDYKDGKRKTHLTHKDLWYTARDAMKRV